MDELLRAGFAALGLPLDAAAGARYNKVCIEPFGTALLFSY